MFAQTKVNISAVDEINLETAAGKVNLLDPSSENPLVMGNQLQSFLNQLITAVKDHEEKLMAFIKPPEGPEPNTKMNAFNKMADEFNTAIENLQNQVMVKEGNKAPFLSNRVFIGVNKTDELDLNNMWDDYEWPEIADVVDDGHEVERVQPSGVRA